ncbi:aspartyl-phosphate phosphatase Spo0E family protein [Fuchsiella alkaliacetigena]|uniref:aspartyl-phosphate phosphatase Spo0E family protein n=1 Tax=Fuchsiella alkaliacetigena TaxID=957042 RepID=UPI00200AFAEE|nr:aspartyl-phosphate phosphatase Spo0E family protein [Fuchsiella alkaliacetigena]MCK8824155.1 aspartyl-phosphate phosphatase Spo0E family protein [Fuchsiella alkaliacetigena]
MGDNQQELAELKKKIEETRAQLNQKLDDNYSSGELNKEVIELSQLLDELLNEYLKHS